MNSTIAVTNPVIGLPKRKAAPTLLLLLAAAASFFACAGALADNGALQKLARLEGSWTADRVEFTGADGSIVRTSSAVAHNAFELGGNVMVHEGRLNDPFIETRSWYFVGPDDGGLRMASVSSSGRYDEFAGGWQGDTLVMLSIPERSTGDRLFRMTHSDVTGDSFVEVLEMSTDGGKTWRTTSRQAMHRLQPSEVLAAMQPYIGRWRSDEKTSRDGQPFYFRYDLDWLDTDRTIARMLIRQIDAAGNDSVIFEGYKGAAADGQVYYHAASPSGRSARGVVIADGDRLVTLYEGWTADGDVVDIRDVFETATDDAFTSRTYLKQPGDVEWRVIGVDHWTRIENDR